MEIAKMNQRITLLEHRTVKDEIGNHITKWEEQSSMWASTDTSNLKTSSETTEAGVTKEVRTLIFTVRQCPSLLYLNSTTHRILFRGQIYNILSVKPDYTDNNYMKITCENREAGVPHDQY